MCASLEDILTKYEAISYFLQHNDIKSDSTVEEIRSSSCFQLFYNARNCEKFLVAAM